MPGISVIVLAFERPGLLAEALDSVASQTRSPDEIVVIDDASGEPLAHSVGSNRSGVRFLRNATNQGPAYGAALGLRSTTGDLVSFLDDDDRWEPTFLERLETGLEDTSASFAFCDHWLMDAGGQVLSQESYASSDRYGRSKLTEGRIDDTSALHVEQTFSAGSFMLAERAALRPRILAAGGAIWDYFAALSVCMHGGPAFYADERLGYYRISPHGVTASGSIPGNRIRAAGRLVAADAVALRTRRFGGHRRALAASLVRTTGSMGKVALRERSPRLLYRAGAEITNALVRPYVASSWTRQSTSR